MAIPSDSSVVPSRPQRRGLSAFLGRSFGAGAVLIAVLVGIQLGSIPWRYRRQIWQLQGFLLGGLAGYVVGRLAGSRALDRGSQQGHTSSSTPLSGAAPPGDR